MELDDFKNTWKQKGEALSQGENINIDSLENTGKDYRSKLKKIIVYELLGILVCLGSTAFIGWHFTQLDSMYLQGIGILAMILLILLPVVSLLSTAPFHQQADINQPYATTLKTFAAQKIRFIKLQKVNVTLSYLLLVTLIILLTKLFNGKDLTDSKTFWLFSFSLGYIFLLVYSRWVMKYYHQLLQQAEGLLQELATVDCVD